MTYSRNIKAILSVLLISLSTSAFAQSNTGLWKKRVTRLIDIRQPGEAKTTNTVGVTLLETLVKEMQSGKLDGYSNIDNEFSTKLSADAMKEMTATKTDTVYTVNAKTKKKEKRIVQRNLNYNLIYKYRILEEWVFDPATLQTEIQITGIAPIREVYGDDGSFRGNQSIFWIKYGAVQSLLAKYEQEHPDNRLTTLIWKDYAKNEPKQFALKAATNEWSKQLSRKINVVSDEKENQLKPAFDDQSLPELIKDEVVAMSIPAYNNSYNNFTDPLQKETIYKLLKGTMDSIPVEDPVTGDIVIATIQRYNFKSPSTYNLAVLENWTFQVQEGKTTIKVGGIGLLQETLISGTSSISPIFWIKYSDAAGKIAKYDQYHQPNSVAAYIWNSYFQSEDKPEFVR